MSGYSEIFTGSVVGFAATVLTVERCGFKPRRIHLLGNDGSEATWIEGMDDGTMVKRIIAGTGSLVATNGLTPTMSGFTLGTDAFNATGVTFHYTLFS